MLLMEQRPVECSAPQAAQGREVGVRAAMLVAPPEQVSHNRSLASSAIDRALPLDASYGGLFVKGCVTNFLLSLVRVR
jgi:hypothetical protein